MDCRNCKTAEHMSGIVASTPGVSGSGRCTKCGWRLSGVPAGAGGTARFPFTVGSGGGGVMAGGFAAMNAGHMTACAFFQHCRLPAGGGACADCGYPKAYAHPGSIDAALTMNEVFVNGTALVIVQDLEIEPGVLRVISRTPNGNFSSVDYRIPTATPAPTDVYDGCTAEQCLERYAAWQRLDSTRDKLLEYPTPCQLAAARELWAAQLRSRVQATSKPKLTVQVDCDE